MLRTRLTAAVTRRYPFLSGCATFANSRLVAHLAGPNDALAWARLSCGAQILVPLDDYVGRAAYFVGDLDRKVSVLLRRLVRAGDTVLDIGANLGVVTLHMSRLVGPQGRVHAFEPNPAVRGLLEQSLAREGARNVALHACALGTPDGATLALSYPRGNAGAGTLTASRRSPDWETVDVPVRTLDALAREAGVDRARVLKIDVEGYEAEVLRSGAAWFRRGGPDFIVFETNERAHSYSEDATRALLREWGYRLFHIPRRLASLQLAESRSGSHTQQSHDMLAAHAHAVDEIATLIDRR